MSDRQKHYVTVDGNEAAAYIAYAFTEIAAIYPITPSSPMAGKTDAWSAKGKKNILRACNQLHLFPGSYVDDPDHAPHRR